MEKEIAVIPAQPMIDETASLSRLNTSKISGNLKDFSGIRLSWNDTIGAIDIVTNEVKKATFDIMIYDGKSIMSAGITEEFLEEMLQYVKNVKSQIGKTIDYEKSFQKA